MVSSFRRIRVAILFSIMLFGSIRAMTNDMQVLDSSGISGLETALSILEDSVQRSELTSKIRAIIDARKIVGEPQPPVSERPFFTINIFERVAQFRQRAFASIENLVTEIRSLEARYHRLRSDLSGKEDRERLLSLLVLLAIAAGAGLLADLLLWRLSRGIQSIPHNQSSQEISYTTRLWEALRAGLLHLSFWSGLAVSGMVFTSFPGLPVWLVSFLRSVTLAFFLYAFLRVVVTALFSPHYPERRLLPLSNVLVGFVVVWAVRILRFSVVMYLLLRVALLVEGPTVQIMTEMLFKAGLAVMLTIMIVKSRNLVKLPSFLQNDSAVPDWQNRLRRIIGYAISKLYIVAIIYLLSIIVVSVLGYTLVYRFLLASTLKTFALMIISFVLWLVWRDVSGRLRSAGAHAFANHPVLQHQMSRNFRMIDRTGYFAIVVLVGLLLLGCWGVDVIAVLRTNKPVVHTIINVGIILVISMLLVQLSYFLVNQIQKEAAARMLASNKTSQIEIEKRVSTLGGVLQKIVLSGIMIVMVMMILDEFGLDIKAMLAGVGVLGIAVGFGAQNLVRDIISGLFVIFENRIRVGDVAIINGTGGLVEQVNLRTTVLRSLDGTVHVFPNGTITTLSNMTHEFSYYVFDIGVAYKEDTDQVSQIIIDLGDEIMKEPEFADAILSPIEILGVDKFADSSVVIKARFKTQPIKQWLVGREMNRRIKKKFDELGIEIPFPHQSLYFGEASKPLKVSLDSGSLKQDELREIVREVIRESAEIK